MPNEPEETELPAYGPQPLFTDEEIENIRSIKLNNGHDILGIIISTDQEHMLVKRPCQVYRQVHDDGTARVILLKWQPFSHSEIHVINTKAYVSYCRVTPDIVDFYKKSVVSQIEEENKEGNSDYVWPEWMDKPTPTQIN